MSLAVTILHGAMASPRRLDRYLAVKSSSPAAPFPEVGLLVSHGDGLEHAMLRNLEQMKYRILARSVVRRCSSRSSPPEVYLPSLSNLHDGHLSSQRL